MMSFLVAAASSGADTVVTSSTIMDILTAITKVFSPVNIVGMVSGILGVSMTFVFLWWGVRKGAKVVIRAVKTGRFSI